MSDAPVYQITFSVSFRKPDGSEISLTFGGVVLDATIGDEKENAIQHVFSKVINDAGVVAQFGKLVPLFKTFHLKTMSRLSDTGMR